MTEENMKKWDSEIFNGRLEAVNYTVSDFVQQIGQLEPAEKGTDNMFNAAWSPVSKNVNTKLINGPQIRKIEKWIGIQVKILFPDKIISFFRIKHGNYAIAKVDMVGVAVPVHIPEEAFSF